MARRKRHSFLPAPRTRTRIVRVAQRGASAAAKAASNEKHTIAAVLGAAVLGHATKNKWKVPQVESLGPAATWGFAAWALGRYTKNRTAQHVATGLLSVAAYEWAMKPSTDGTDGDDMSGSIDGDQFTDGEE